jgi:hypothetical protein
MPDHFIREPQSDGTERWYLQNPSAPEDNLAATMHADRQAGFAWWHDRVTQQVTRILDAIDNHEGFDVVLETVKDAFGERAARSIQAAQARLRERSRALGRVALIPAAGTAVGAAARPHTFFGEP